MSANRVQDLDLLQGGQLDDRRLEVVADGSRPARRTKERRYPKLTGEHGGARVVVLACAGGRWSEEAHDSLRQSKVGTTGDPRSGATLLVQTLVHSIVMLCAQVFAMSLNDLRCVLSFLFSKKEQDKMLGA